MAVGHYQFEAIHPFEDGNGRTGRILNLLFVVEQGFRRRPFLSMSSASIRDKAAYYRRLLDVTTDGKWEAWLLYMIGVVETTAHATTAKIRALRNLLEVATTYVREHEPKIYRRELVELLFEKPYCRIANLVKAGIAKRQTASTYLSRLSMLITATGTASGTGGYRVCCPVESGRRPLTARRDL